MRLFKVTTSLLLSLLTICFAENSMASTKPFVAKKSFTFDGLTCASKNGKKFYAGTFIKVKRKKVFELLTVKIAALKKRAKSRSIKTRNAAKKDLKKFQALQKKSWICSIGKKPTLTATDGVVGSTGLQPVAVSLSVKSSTNKAPIEFDIVAQSGSGTISKYPNLNALVVPASHRTGRIDFRYVARQKIGSTTIKSKPATVSVYWLQTGEFIGDPFSLATYRDSLSVREAQHLARWMNLGAESEQIVNEATSPGGLDRVVAKMLSRSGGNCAAAEAEAQRIANMDRRVPCRTIEVMDDQGVKRYPWFCGVDLPANKELWLLEAGQNYFLHMSRYGCEPMRERMANFWSNHFAVNLGNYSNWTEKSHYIKSHIDLIRSKSAGNALLASFPSLLAKMHGEDGAMLLTLNNNKNEYGTFGNENYARELLELFSMGKRDAVTGQVNYVEADVYATSFAVMGWTEQRTFVKNMTFSCDPTFDNQGNPTNECARLPANKRTLVSEFNIDKPIFNENRWNHPTRPTKQLFFEGTPWSSYEAYKSDTTRPGQDTFTPYLLTHPGVARYLATRLLTTFVTTEPTDQMVSEVAAIVRNSNYAIEPALGRLLTSSAFYARAGRNGIASPYETAVSLVRGLNLPLGRSEPGASVSYNLYNAMRDLIGSAGQRLFQHPTIFGYEEIGKITGGKIHSGIVWLNLQSWLERSRGFINYLNQIHAARTPLAFSWKQLIPAGSMRNPTAIVEHILKRSGVSVSESKKAVLVSYLTTASLRTKVEGGVRVSDTVYHRSINWGKLNEAQLNELLDLKVPGLISIVAQLKEANVR